MSDYIKICAQHNEGEEVRRLRDLLGVYMLKNETLVAEVRRLREELKEAKGKYCRRCSGSGMITSPGTGFYDCPACNGRGY